MHEPPTRTAPIRGFPRVASLFLLLGTLTIVASCTAGSGRAPAPTALECQQREEARLLARGISPEANRDSMREASLDSAAANYGRRRPRTAGDDTLRLDRPPRILERWVLEQRMESLYPANLLALNQGGTAHVLFVIEPDSVVRSPRLVRSSGFYELDQASLRAVDELRMTPGIYRGCRVPTVIALPITWVPRRPPVPRP